MPLISGRPSVWALKRSIRSNPFSRKKGYSTAVGDEGGFAPNLKSNEEAVEVILDAITKAGYKPGDDISICLDPAASEMWDSGKYVFFKSDKSSKTSEQMVKYWACWVGKYPIVLLEDGMAENDWNGWKLLTDEIGDKIELVGDDIFCTNPAILAQGIDNGIGKFNTHQVEPDRYAFRNSLTLSNWRQKTIIVVSFRIGQAKPKIRRLPT